MECTRIQKLLRAEYQSLIDGEMLLVESPFAETTREGRGLREVALGLTPTKLIVASDVFRDCHYTCPADVDASIESLELITVYPLEFLKLSVFRRRQRKALKVRLIDGRFKYFELGGLGSRQVYWAKWCKCMHNLLKRNCFSSSLSETTVAVSTTCTRASYCVSSDFECDSTSGYKRQQHCTHFIGAGDAISDSTWTRKTLYSRSVVEKLGNESSLLTGSAYTSSTNIKGESRDCSSDKSNSKSWLTDSNYCYEPQLEQLCEVKNLVDNAIFMRKNDRSYVDQRLIAAPIRENLELRRNRHELLNFRPEDCNDCSNIQLDIEKPKSDVFTYTCDKRKISKVSKKRIKKMHELIESGVTIWERDKKLLRQSPKDHLRSYGISTATHFLYALGPWAVQPGDRDSVQTRRSHSCVTIRRQPVDPEFRLRISRRQLVANVSLADLNNNLPASSRGKIVLFWTPDYWYRPRAAVDAYSEIRSHFGRLKKFRSENDRKKGKRGAFLRKSGSQSGNKEPCDIFDQSTDSNNNCMLNRRSSSNSTDHQANYHKKEFRQPYGNGTTAHLRKLLKLDFRITLWDLNSTTLAHQLTLIDRELFLRIPKNELEILTQQRTSRNAPNISAWIAFAHRISCLIASEVLAVRKFDMRASLIARLLSVAEQCFVSGNFQSARSVIAGLQSPAIYRLKATWMHLKIYHATKYETMEKLSKLFKSTRTKKYSKAWMKTEKNPPLMPFVGDVLVRMLGLCNGDTELPYLNLLPKFENSSRKTNSKAVRKQKPIIRKKRGLKRIRSPIVDGINDSHKNLSVICQQKLTRQKHIDKVNDWLQWCQKQAKAYDYPGHSLAWEFLLKARYTEDKDNFFESQQLEPPCSYCPRVLITKGFKSMVQNSS